LREEYRQFHSQIHAVLCATLRLAIARS
jgi:hypothetical protein